MGVRFNDLGRTSELERSALLEDIEMILESGSFLNGLFSERLRSILKSSLSVNGVTLVGNGTDALRVALMSLGVTSGSRVVTVGNAGGYASGAALSLGATPVLVDVSAETAQMEPDSLRRALESRERPDVIVVTHLYGLMAPIIDLVDLASAAGVPVVEDVAQAFGARIAEGPAGSFGSLATTSFYPTKNLGSIGDAGAIFSSSNELGDRCARLAQYGWGERYVVESLSGVNSRMDEIHAATLCQRLSSVHHQNAQRRAIVADFNASLGPKRRVIHSEGESFVGHLAVMTTPERDRDRERLTNAGIETAIHYPIPDHLQPAWEKMIETPVPLANTETLARQVLSVPCFPSMTEAEIDQVRVALEALGD